MGEERLELDGFWLKERETNSLYRLEKVLLLQFGILVVMGMLSL
jgi:hypothetical protein